MTFAALALFGLPLLVGALLVLRIRRKRDQRNRFLQRIHGLFLDLGATPMDERSYRLNERVYTIDANLSPLVGRGLTLRLSTWCDSVHEFELHRPGHPVEVKEYLHHVKERLSSLVPARWSAFSKQHLEVILSGNRFNESTWTAAELRSDLSNLSELAAVPLRRPFTGGVVTFREGFERNLPAWHWKPDQLDRIPKTARRVVFSFHRDNTYLNIPIVELLYALAGTRRKVFITDRDDLDFVSHGFGEVLTHRGRCVEISNPEAAVAADQYLDGDFFQGFFACDDSEAVRTSNEREIRFNFRDRAIDLLDTTHFYCRRLLDEESAWFSGEYEIISTRLDPSDVRRAIEEMAARCGARFVEINRRFRPRLLKEDRLDAIEVLSIPPR